MLRHKKIRKELEALGDLGPREIRKKLADLNITGTRGHYRDCALAEYFKLVDAKHDVSISQSEGTDIEETLYYMSVNGKRYFMPDSLSLFIINFDGGAYPELDNGKPKPNPDNFLW